MDWLTRYGEFVDRRLVEIAVEARKSAKAIDGDLSAKGQLNSGTRILRQTDNVKRHVIGALNLLIGAALELPGQPHITREFVEDDIRPKLHEFLKGIFWDLPSGFPVPNSRIPMIIEESKAELRKLVDGELSDYRAGFWRPRASETPFGQAAPTPATTINHNNSATFHAPVYGTTVQQAGQGSSLEAKVEMSIDLRSLNMAVVDFEAALDGVDLDAVGAAEVRADLQVVKAQLAKATPSEGKIKGAVGEIVGVVREVATGAAGNVLAPYLLALLAAAGLS